MYELKPRKHEVSRDGWCNCCRSGCWMDREGQHHRPLVTLHWTCISTLHMLLLAFFTPPHMLPSRDETKWARCSCTRRVTSSSPSTVIYRRNYATTFHIKGWPGCLSRTRRLQYALTDVDNGLCGLLKAHCWLTITWAVFGKQWPERQPKTL